MTGLSVVFVCTANICRSPFLELTARELSGPESTLSFSSAGTMGFSGKPMDEAMASNLASGVGTAEFRSRPLSAAILTDADLVLTAEREHRTRILEEYPHLLRKVFTVGQFAAGVEAHPELRGAELVAKIGARRKAPTPEQDISDPYRKGAEAAQESAALITALLGRILPALT